MMNWLIAWNAFLAGALLTFAYIDFVEGRSVVLTLPAGLLCLGIVILRLVAP